MSQVQQCGCRHKYDLQHPEVHMRDWERLVIADVFTARLLSVTTKGRLLITPSRLNCCPK
jgi:hypothetical protein